MSFADSIQVVEGDSARARAAAKRDAYDHFKGVESSMVACLALLFRCGCHVFKAVLVFYSFTCACCRITRSGCGCLPFGIRLLCCISKEASASELAQLGRFLDDEDSVGKDLVTAVLGAQSFATGQLSKRRKTAAGPKSS